MSKPLRELDREARVRAGEVLRLAPLAYVAVSESTGPYVVPMNFVYVEGGGDPGNARPRIYLHTGPGRKTTALAGDPRVCVAVTMHAELVRGPTPCEDGFHYRSVLVEGKAVLLVHDEERESALRAIVAKYDPDGSSAAFDEQVFAQTFVYAIDIEKVGYKERPRRPPV